jgi:2,3-bisphosphoglycerate-independent phosphoglycerate mutase
MRNKKALLIILDGWGKGKGDASDAIHLAKTPFMDESIASRPQASLKTFGSYVGLPEGQMGNSEVGHLNIGAGRVVYQMLERINITFQKEEFLIIPAMQNLLAYVKNSNQNVHLWGLWSDGGVHSHMEHALEFLRLMNEQGLGDRIYIHAVTDGRDCDPKSGLGFLKALEKDPRKGKATLATIIGRYFAMDRDKRWERVQKAYDALVHRKGKKTKDLLKELQNCYAENETDEFIQPLVQLNNQGEELPGIQDGDAVVCFNFRTDRARELTQALSQLDDKLPNMTPLDLKYFTFTEYDKTFSRIEVFFNNDDIKNTLGEYLSYLGLTQIRAAETEKYPHVTFFFSGGRENPFPGEKRLLVNSPKVATYDLKPEMSALELTDLVIETIRQEKPDFGVVNFANPDMVGHTGVLDAVIQACEVTDSCARKVVSAALSQEYEVILIADHGNADFVVNDDGSPNTAHSKNLVPCVYYGDRKIDLREGVLGDVAPTILELMGLPKPAEMTGNSLITNQTI